jgi:hypothetical protein
MGDGGLADADRGSKIVDAQLARAERVENPNPGGITKNAERVGDGLNVVWSQHMNV